MNKLNRTFVGLALLGSMLVTAQLHASGGAFQSLSFNDAVAKATEAKKFIFIDFYTTWCGPCKMMDRDTFPDANVQKWLSEKAVALQIDAERDIALADRFRIDSYPTLLFLNPDGSEFDRISGYVTPDEFLKFAHGVEKGETSIDRMRKEMGDHANDPLVRMQFASALAGRGEFAESLKEFLWCFDHGVENSSDFADIRNSYLIMELMNLSRVHPPTIKALADRAGAAESLLRTGKGTKTDVDDLVLLNQLIDEPTRTIAVYDALMAGGASDDIVAAFEPHLFNMRIAAKRYADVVAAKDVDKDIDQRLKDLAQKPSGISAVFTSDDSQQLAIRRAEALERLMGYYQAFVGVGDSARAAQLADKVLAVDKNPDILNGLAWSAYLSGKATQVNVDQAEEALKPSNGASVDVLDTLVRVLDQMGRTDEAIRRCKTAIAKTDDEMERRILQACLKDFGAS
ncbi:MAG: thioredoxin fold domain-containing protein [Phycisphaerales bacterium]|nr:thioredoxin fold domain-containing protein [Phycisphaerales bacterium]